MPSIKRVAHKIQKSAGLSDSLFTDGAKALEKAQKEVGKVLIGLQRNRNKDDVLKASAWKEMLEDIGDARTRLMRAELTFKKIVGGL